MDFTKIEDRSALANGRLSIGITRYNTTVIKGTGGLAVNLVLPLLANAPAGEFKIMVNPVGCNDNNGVDIKITGSEDSLTVSALITKEGWADSIYTDNLPQPRRQQRHLGYRRGQGQCTGKDNRYYRQVVISIGSGRQ